MYGRGKTVSIILTGLLLTNCGKAIESSSEDDILDAAAKGDLARVTLLVEEGADVNAAQLDGATPLHHAALVQDTALAEFLLDHGADLTATTNTAETPLHWAAAAGEQEIVRMLIKGGADVNARNEEGLTPLDLAERGDGSYADLVNYLRSAGALRGTEVENAEPEDEAVAPARRGPAL